MSNKFSNFLEELKSVKKINKKNYFNSYYKKAPGKENYENFFDESELNLNLLEQNSCLKKNRKIQNGKKFHIREKIFYKNGQSIRFLLFREDEIGLKRYGKNVNILDSEEDYDSDDNLIKVGVKKVKDDLSEAVRKLERNKFEVINGLKIYGKYMK